jgi:hypothetical protein
MLFGDAYIQHNRTLDSPKQPRRYAPGMWTSVQDDEKSVSTALCGVGSIETPRIPRRRRASPFSPHLPLTPKRLLHAVVIRCRPGGASLIDDVPW